MLIFELKIGFLIKNCIFWLLDMSRIPKSGPKMTPEKKVKKKARLRYLAQKRKRAKLLASNDPHPPKKTSSSWPSCIGVCIAQKPLENEHFSDKTRQNHYKMSFSIFAVHLTLEKLVKQSKKCSPKSRNLEKSSEKWKKN